jgi:TctA family transporter
MTSGDFFRSRTRLANREAQAASDIALGLVLSIVAALTIWDGRDLPLAHWYEFNSKGFPSAVSGLLIAVAAVLLVRGIFAERAPASNWTGTSAAIVVIGAVAFAILLFAPIAAIADLLLRFGPSDFAALVVCILAVAIALARRSRVRATGMVLLGLLLATVGMDAVTGQLRLTMGIEELLDGFDQLVLAAGLIVVADGLVGLLSPALLLESYGWLVARWRGATVGVTGTAILRTGAAIALVAACYLAYDINSRVWDIGLIFLFGILGAAGKLFGWNRLLLLLGFSYSTLLEEKIRQSLLISDGDPTIFFRWPISAILLTIAAGALAVAAFGSLRTARAPAPR